MEASWRLLHPSVYPVQPAVRYVPTVDTALARAQTDYYKAITRLVELQIAQLVQASSTTDPPAGLYS